MNSRLLCSFGDKAVYHWVVCAVNLCSCLCDLWTVICELQSSNCNLQIATCELQSAICNLQSVNSKLRVQSQFFCYWHFTPCLYFHQLWDQTMVHVKNNVATSVKSRGHGNCGRFWIWRLSRDINLNNYYNQRTHALKPHYVASRWLLWEEF